MGKSVDDMIKGLEQENDALKKRVKKLESNLSRAKYALDEEIYRGMEYKEKVKELEERIKQERDFAEMLADKSRLIAIDRADKAEASLTISEKSRKVLRDSYFKLEDQADKWESDLAMLKEAVKNHEKARKMGVRGSGVDSELYSASDKIEKGAKW